MGKRARANQAGFTLVETMITLGIAAGLVLAVMDAVNYATKASRSTSIGNDFTTMLMNARLVLATGNNCTTILGTQLPQNNAPSPAWPPGTYFVPTTPCGGATCKAPNGTAFLNLTNTAMTVKAITTPGGSAIFNTGIVTPTNGIVTNSITLTPIVNPLGPQFVWQDKIVCPPNGCYYAMDTMELDITASKVQSQIFGPSGQVTGTNYFGTSQTLVANSAKGNAIYVDVLHDSNGMFKSCVGSVNPGYAQQACVDLGGTYSPNTRPNCLLPYLPFMAGNYSYPPTAPMVGERIQFVGTPGTFAAMDTSIGLAAQDKMWFNLGSNNGSPTFDFHADNGGTDIPLAQLWGSGSKDYITLDLDPKTLGTSQITFGGNGTFGPPPVKYGPFIQYNSQGADFYKNALLIFTSGSNPAIAFSQNGDTMLFGDANSNTDILYFNTSKPGDSGESIQSNRNAGVLDLSLWTGGNKRIGITNGGGVSILSTGGNVPHGCHVSSAQNSNTLTCGAGEIVVGGGAQCGVLPGPVVGNVCQSRPIDPGGGNPPTQWWGLCNYSNSCSVAPDWIYAICCPY